MKNDHFLPHMLARDTPFRHAVLLSVSAYKEHMQQKPLSATTYMHHRATVALLNARLSDTPENFLIDSTFYIINTLAHVAIWLARHDEVAAHVLALKHMAHRRGGKAFLNQRPFLKYQINW
jgi:hypothetical protein